MRSTACRNGSGKRSPSGGAAGSARQPCRSYGARVPAGSAPSASTSHRADRAVGRTGLARVVVTAAVFAGLIALSIRLFGWTAVQRPDAASCEDAHRGSETAVDVEIAVDVTVPDICSRTGVFEGSARNAFGARSRWAVGEDLERVGESIIGEYASDPALSLEYDGYLDLLGRVWACVVFSREGWVEYAVVDGRDGEERAFAEDGVDGCEVTVVRLNGSDRGGGWE